MTCQDGMIGCFQAKTIPFRSQLSAPFPEIQPVSCACQSARIWKRLDTLSRTVMPSRICCPRQIRATRITRQGDLPLPESGKGGHQDIAPIEDDRREKKAVNHAGHESGGQNFIKQVSDAVSFLQGRSRICAMLPIRCARPAYPGTWVNSRSTIRVSSRKALRVENGSTVLPPPLKAPGRVTAEQIRANHRTAGTFSVIFSFFMAFFLLFPAAQISASRSVSCREYISFHRSGVIAAEHAAS